MKTLKMQLPLVQAKDIKTNIDVVVIEDKDVIQPVKRFRKRVIFSLIIDALFL